MSITYTCVDNLYMGYNQVLLARESLHIGSIDLKHLHTLPKGEKTIALLQVSLTMLYIEKREKSFKIDTLVLYSYQY